MTLAIAARGLEKRFGRVHALRGIDLEVPRGTTLAVLGPNGAGKSTLLRLLAGLSRASAGSLLVGEADPARARASDRRRVRAAIGYLGHATFLYPDLTARENLLFAARLHGVADARARADALLAQQGLEGAADRLARSFSRGMAQRLAIARSLVHDPAIVLLDEPFTGLDPAAGAALELELRRMHQEGRTLVLVTHELGRARGLADAAIVLARGRVVHRAATLAELDPLALEAGFRRGLERTA
ncbi:MAG TPA: ABC transporter ATP-binding protein [Myxococcota bacterium]|nr:ABC transporter ATP-binding protein [Myxococcota bacterium]